MNSKTVGFMGIAAAIALGLVAVAQAEVRLPLRLHNRLRLEWDDNIRQTEEDTDSSLKIIEEIQLSYDLELEQTSLTLRYRPSLVWWDNRPEDDTDLHHAFDLSLTHSFSPRVGVSLQDTLRYNDLPELIDRDTVLRQEQTYLYNTASGSLHIEAVPGTHVDLTGRYVTLRYDQDEVAKRSDYDLVVGGIDVRHQLQSDTTVAAQFRYEVLDYEKDDRFDRGSTALQGGARLERIFNPSVIGSFSAGMQYRDYDDAFTGSDSSPYADASLTYLFSPATRMTGGASYSVVETDVFPYGSQRRIHSYLSLAHDLTGRVSWYLSGSYMRGEYEAETLPQGARVRDLPAGDRRDVPPEALDQPLDQAYVDSIVDKQEDSYRVSSRLTYQVNRNHSLEAGWQFSMLDSELRPDYDRNRFHIGWRARLY